jgi:hypothetical protein
VLGLVLHWKGPLGEATLHRDVAGDRESGRDEVKAREQQKRGVTKVAVRAEIAAELESLDSRVAHP